MDEKELRTGNAIYIVSVKNPKNKTLGKITGCKKREVEPLNKLESKNIALEPIPISDEILLNNGFTKNPSYPDRYYFPKTGTYFVKRDNDNYYIGMEDFGDDRRVSMSLIYLHQLQNAIYYIRGCEIYFTKLT